MGGGRRGGGVEKKKKVLLGFPGPAFVILDRPLGGERKGSVSVRFVVRGWKTQGSYFHMRQMDGRTDAWTD